MEETIMNISDIGKDKKEMTKEDSKDENIEDKLDSCESILSSINEECIKISREKENGITHSLESLSESGDKNNLEIDDQPSKDIGTNEDLIEPPTLIHKVEVSATLLKDKVEHPTSGPPVKDPSEMSSLSPKKDYLEKENLTVDKPEYEIPKTDPMEIESETEECVENTVDGTPPRDGDGVLDNEAGGGVKIKLRSFASLCEADDAEEVKENHVADRAISTTSVVYSSGISGVTVGDIVEHSNIVESDESGVMHLKISNVVGGEDCITGLAVDEEKDCLLPIQISSVASLVEPLSPSEDTNREKDIFRESSIIGSERNIRLWPIELSRIETPDKSDSLFTDDGRLQICTTTPADASATQVKPIVNIFKSPLVVQHVCSMCHQKARCEFRIVLRGTPEGVSFICSEACRVKAVHKLSQNYSLQKPRLYFERICGMCGRDVSALAQAATIYNWQTKEFCNKLCLADHIGEVARACFICKQPVRVLYMVKYCVRFGSEVHQFCSNICLESFKSKIKVCSFCQKNLTGLDTILSPSNKEYCSQKCLKRAQRRDIGQMHYKDERECTVCCKKTVNKYEFVYSSTSTWLCSDPCLNVFKYAKHVKSVNCCLCARLLNAEDSCNYFFNGKQLRVFCSESCLSVFVISARKIVTCEYCKVKKYSFDMIFSLECYYCSVCCLNLIENQNEKPSLTNEVFESGASAPSPSPAPESSVPSLSPIGQVSSEASATTVPITKQCSMCSKVEPAQFHMVMSDSTLRSFCSYLCATKYKCTYGFQVSGGVQTLPSDKGNFLAVINDSDKMDPNQAADDGVKGPKFDKKALESVMSMFTPPQLRNKATMCKPNPSNKGVQCRPYQWYKSTQTESSGSFDKKAICPIPVPVYVPTPMMMYSATTPVPLVIPIPVPVPVFIPTSEKTTEELEKRIKDILEKLPSDPAEADLLLLAKKQSLDAEDINEMSDLPPLAATNDLSSDDLIPQDQEEDEVESHLEMIARIHNMLPRYSLGDLENNINGPSDKKRKVDLNEGSITVSRPKRAKYDEPHLVLSHGVSVWKAWVKKKLQDDPGITSRETKLLLEDFSTMSGNALDLCLRIFLKDLSSDQDKQIDADTLFYLLLGIQRHIFEHGSTFCIFLELKFEKFTSTFDKVIKSFYASRNLPDPVVSKRLLETRVTEEMLWEARQLGAHTPHVLLNTLFYFNTKVFHLKKAEHHFNLTLKVILKEWKRTKLASDVSVTSTALLKYTPPTENTSQRSVTYEMCENKDDPLRCPVKLYEFYLSKCPESVQSQSFTYYVYPEQSCLPDSPVWFSTSPLRLSTLEQMLNRILLVREVQDALFSN